MNTKKLKIHIVAQKYKQEEIIDFSETFALVV